MSASSAASDALPDAGPFRRRTAALIRGRLGWGPAFLPFTLLIGLVLIAPVVTFLRLAFANGFADWRAFVDSPVQIHGVIRTLFIALETTAICSVLGYAYAGALVHARRRSRALLMVVIVLPFLTSILVRSYGWIVLLGDQGPINRVLRATTGGSVALLYNRIGLMIGMVHIMLPFFVLPLFAVWSQVQPNLRRASRTLGANRVESFLRVDLPLTLPGAAAGALLVFITSLGFFVTPALLGGDSDVMVSQLIDRALSNEVNLNEAAVLATVLLAVVLLVLLLFRLFYPIELLFVQDAATLGSRQSRTRRRWRPRSGVVDRYRRTRLVATSRLSLLPWPALNGSLVALLVIFFLAPLVIVVPVAFSGDSYLTFPPHSLSLRWFESVISDGAWRQAALNSLVTGVIATLLSLCIGLPLAFGLVRSRLRARVKGAVMLVATVPVIIPVIVLALGVYAWYLDERLVGNRIALAAAQALLGVPFLTVIVVSALRDFDARLERAARSLGASATSTLRRITLPVIQRSIWAGLLFAFLQSFDELLIARAVSNVDSQTLPVKMWAGANEQISPALATVSVVSLSVTIIVVLSLVGLRRATARRHA